MKFFMQLGPGFEKNRAHLVYHYVHGPFADDEEMNALINELWANDKQVRLLVFEAEIVGVRGFPLEKPEPEKRAPDPTRWTKFDDKYVCNDCGATIMSATVAHPIHDGPFPLSGSGRVETEVVGYCPNCEKKPSFHGAPIRR